MGTWAGLGLARRQHRETFIARPATSTIRAWGSFVAKSVVRQCAQSADPVLQGRCYIIQHQQPKVYYTRLLLKDSAVAKMPITEDAMPAPIDCDCAKRKKTSTKNIEDQLGVVDDDLFLDEDALAGADEAD